MYVVVDEVADKEVTKVAEEVNRNLVKKFNEGLVKVYLCKGRMEIPKRMFFRKSSKRGGGHFQSKNLYCRFWTFKQGFLSMKMLQKGHFRVCFSTNYHVELLYHMHLMGNRII